MTEERDAQVQIVVAQGIDISNSRETPKIVGPTLVLAMPLRKTLLSFNVSVLTYGLNLKTSHSVKLSIVEKDVIISTMESKLENIPDFVGGFVFNFSVTNALFKEAGEHRIDFYVDNHKVNTQKFWTVYTGQDD